MDTKKLRQKILDLAIRGKLVPQDPNDEPASVLLDRIRAEKERLIAEGKIKRPKKSKASSAESQYQNFDPPFEIPTSWEWVRLGEVCNSNIGLTYKPTDVNPSGVPVYRSNNIQNRKIDTADLVRVTCQIADNQFLNEGDLLICARNGSRRLVGKCAIIHSLSEPTSFGAFMAVCRSNYNQWINLILNSDYFDRYLDASNSTAINQVTQKMLLEFPIPFPSELEQLRIVREIQLIDSAIDVLNLESGELKNRIVSAKSKILDLAMQGKLVPQDPTDEPATEMLRRVNPKAEIIGDNPHSWNIPKSWVWCRLGDIFFHNTGKALNSSNHEGKLLPYLTTSNVYWERFELETVKSMYFKESELDKCSIYDGDLLVCEGGDVGRAAIWDNTETMMIQNHLHRLRPKGNEILSHFYLKVFKHYKEKDLIGGKGIGLLGFSSKVLHNLVVPLPPFEEQRRIIEAFNTLFETLDEIEASLQA